MFEEITKIMDLMEYHQYDWHQHDLDEACNKRSSGHYFTWQEHLEAMILSLLSGNRPWRQIAASIDSLRKVFLDYQPDALMQVDPDLLESQVCSIGCGNRRIHQQMQELRYNINVLRNIERNYGDVDMLANMAVVRPLEVATMLSYNGGIYKIKGFGKALALEYLRRVGVDAVKPDVHVRRILQRFGYFSYLPSEDETFQLVKNASVELGMTMHDIGAVLWNFCATGYMQICEATPRCRECIVQCQSSTCAPTDVQELIEAVYTSRKE